MKKAIVKNKTPRQVKNSSNSPLNGIFDSYANGPVAPLSTPWELANNTAYNLVSLQRVMLSYAYVIFGPLRTLVDQPVYDAFRGGITVKCDEVSPEDIEALNKEMKKLKVQRKLVDALRWDNLFGGAGIIVNTDQDYSKELKVDSISEKSKLEFIPADRWELAWQGVPNTPKAFFSYYGKTVHQSRVAKIIGEEPPSLVRQRLQGWGMSKIECVIRELNSYFKNNNVVFELMDEAKVDIWKIKGFNSQVLAGAAQGKTVKRIQIATMMKSFLNAITLDSEDDYEQKQVSFAGMSEVLEQIRIGMAAAVRMPMAKIFGLASKGFASGEDDIENYNAIVEQQRERAEDVAEVIFPILMMKVWGFVPDSWSLEWKPLRVLSAEQEQNVLTSKFERAKELASMGMVTPQEFMEHLKQEKIFVMDTAVLAGDEPQPLMQAGQAEELEIASSAAKPSAGKKPTKEKV